MTEGAALGQPADLRPAIAAFYDRSIREVYRYFHRAAAGDRREAEDLTQETYAVCVRAARAGVEDALTMPWLMGVARHKLIDHYRRRSRELRRLSWAEHAPDRIGTSQHDPADTEAYEALAQLSPLHRLVLVLRYVDDLSVNEVAIAIGKSVHATESLIVRARHALGQVVKEESDA